MNLKLTLGCMMAAMGMLSAQALPEAETFDSALKMAKDKKLSIMMEFTGTDWCTACIHLKEKILESDEFEKAFGDKVVLTLVDFPRTPELKAKISKEESMRREALMTSYRVEGLPAVVVADENGFPYAIIQGSRGSAKEYVALISEAFKVRKKRDAAFFKAKRKSGMERAEALANGLKLLPQACWDKYPEIVKEINQLDPENALGFKNCIDTSLTLVKQTAEFYKLTESMVGRLKPEQVMEDMAKINKVLERDDILPEIRQMLLRLKGDSYALLREVEKCYEAYEEAYNVAPETRIGKKLKSNLDYYKQMKEQQK